MLHELNESLGQSFYDMFVFQRLGQGLSILPLKMCGTKCLWICYSIDIFGAVQYKLQVVQTPAYRIHESITFFFCHSFHIWKHIHCITYLVLNHSCVLLIQNNGI
jgi:hypothetical protein